MKRSWVKLVLGIEVSAGQSGIRRNSSKVAWAVLLDTGRYTVVVQAGVWVSWRALLLSLGS